VSAFLGSRDWVASGSGADRPRSDKVADVSDEQSGDASRDDAAPVPSTVGRTVGAARPIALTAAVGLVVVEGLAVIAYTVGIGIAAVQEPGSVAAAPVEIVIYLIFAAAMLACGRALWRRRRAARTPFGVIQLFGLVVGWTLTQGDGDLTQRIGYAVLVGSVTGIALAISPALGEALED
jgi:hypothetical protein